MQVSTGLHSGYRAPICSRKNKLTKNDMRAISRGTGCGVARSGGSGTNLLRCTRLARGHTSRRQAHRILCTSMPDDGSDGLSSDAMNDNLMRALNDEMSKRMSQLSGQLGDAERKLKLEQEMQRELAPYRVSSPKYGIVGNSRYAVKLRKQIVAASHDEERKPVLIFGEPGLHKFNIATLIHFGSKYGRYPLVTLDCTRLDARATVLFGRRGKKGLLQKVPEQGTIILTNVHKALPEVLDLLSVHLGAISYDKSIDDLEYDVENLSDQEERRFQSSPRIVMTAEMRVPILDSCVTAIQVPPLRVRAKDIRAIVEFHLRVSARDKGLGSISLTPQAMRRLESGKFPNNISELEASIDRAVAQSRQGKSNDGDATDVMELGEEVFWFASGSQVDQFRADVLKPLPLFRKFLRSMFWPREINFKFTVYVYAAIVLYLFFGPQDRDHNFALNAFWCYWWPLSFIAYPFFGRVWCSICPFMIYGELVQKLRLDSGATLMKWPKEFLDQWGYLFLTSLFTGILIWEEVWDLPQHAYLSSSLLLLITAGAMIGSFFYERRVWCRYLCPIGGMNGLFAKMAATELRAVQGVCSAECSTYGCYKGGPAVPPEGMASTGCPLYSHPAQLTDNRNCVLCMECLKACPHSSVEFRIRIPGADLWNSSHKPIPEEIALAFILLGSVALHRLPVVLSDYGLSQYQDMIFSNNAYHIAASIFMLGFPGVTAFALDSLWRFASDITHTNQSPRLSFSSVDNSETAQAMQVLSRATASYQALEKDSLIVAPSKSFMSLGYGYLPLVWSSILAYYLELLLVEAGTIVQVAGSSVGIPEHYLPSISADASVVTFLQASTLLLGISSSLVLSRRIASQPWRVFIPQCICIVGFGAELWHLLLH